LDKFDEGLHYGRLIRIVFLGLRPEPMRCFLGELGAVVGSRSTSLGHLNAPLGSVCAQLAHVSPTQDRSSAKFLSRVLGLSTSLFSGCTSLTASFIKRNPGSTETLALGKEAFASIPLDNEFLMLVPKLIPQGMELSVVRSVHNMTEPVFMSWWPKHPRGH
jgi:hypothetical protein